MFVASLICALTVLAVYFANRAFHAEGLNAQWEDQYDDAFQSALDAESQRQRLADELEVTRSTLDHIVKQPHLVNISEEQITRLGYIIAEAVKPKVYQN